MHRALLTASSLALICGAPLPASANPSFGEHDVRTVFYISKSDDRNRVDYGVHLDAECRPVGDAPVYAYWRRFEPNQPELGDLNFADRRAYAIQSQSVQTASAEGTWIELRLRALPSERLLVLVQRRVEAGGGCRARARVQIRGRDAILDHIHVRLAGPLRVRDVTVRGEDVQTGTPVFERRAR